MTELQSKFKPQFCIVFAFKLRALIVKKWDPESWKEDTWKDTSESGDIEPLNSAESFWPREVYPAWVYPKNL